jgi:hypothetical protein
MVGTDGLHVQRCTAPPGCPRQHSGLAWTISEARCIVGFQNRSTSASGPNSVVRQCRAHCPVYSKDGVIGRQLVDS